MTHSAEDPPLKGIRVLEFGEGVAAPAAAAYLGDLGADVVKVESPEGDRERRAPGFAAWNRGKRSFCLDLREATGRSSLMRAAAAADVLLVDESWLRRMRSAGLDLDALAGGISAVTCTVPQVTTDDRWEALPLDDDAVAAFCGMQWAQPGHEPGPTRYAFPALAAFSGMLAAAGCAAGLVQRRRFGRAGRVDVPQAAVVAALMGMVGNLPAAVVGNLPPRKGRVEGLHESYRCFRAQDGWVCVACTSPDFYSRFCLAMDAPELVVDPRFENAPWAVPEEHRAAQRQILEPRIAALTVEACMARFREYDVPAQRVQTLERFLESDLAASNELLVPMGEVRGMRFPARLDAFQQREIGPAPVLGSSGGLVQLEWDARPAPRSEGALPAPLAGMRVLDFTTYLAGPICGAFLGDLGAQVIKVEPPGGEGLRSSGLSCVGINRGKRGLSVDLKKSEGRAIIDALLPVDVVLTGFRPGIDARLGLAPEQLRARDPRISSVAFNGYGTSPAHAELPSFDPLIQALSGQMLLQGGDRGPVFFMLSLNDFAAGYLGLLCTLVQLWRREESGLGGDTEVTQAAAALALIANHVVARERGEVLPECDEWGRDALHRLYEAADGDWLYLCSTASGVDTEALGDALELDACTLEGLDTGTRGQLAAGIERRLRERPRHEWLARSTEALALVPVGDEYIRRQYDPVFAETGCTARYSHAFFGELVSAARAIRIEGSDHLLQAGPWVGEHTREILAGLGYDDATIDQLYEERVVATPVPGFAKSRGSA